MWERERFRGKGGRGVRLLILNLCPKKNLLNSVKYDFPRYPEYSTLSSKPHCFFFSAFMLSTVIVGLPMITPFLPGAKKTKSAA